MALVEIITTTQFVKQTADMEMDLQLQMEVSACLSTPKPAKSNISTKERKAFLLLSIHYVII